MNPFLLYLLLLKATMTSFAGMAALPALHDSFVVHHRVLTDMQLSEAVAISRSTPGPVGLYVVSVGYFVGGWPGAIAGWLALITPALFIIPLIHFVGRRMNNPRVKSALQAILVASAGLLAAATIPLAQSALTSPPLIVIALVSLGVLFTTKLDTLWIIFGAALAALSVSAVSLSI